MLLTQLLKVLQPLAVSGETEGRWVSSVVFDSRKVEKDSLFVAVRGTQTDGHDYIKQAIAAGACAVVGADAGAMEREGSRVEAAAQLTPSDETLSPPPEAAAQLTPSDETLSPTPPHGGGATGEANASLSPALSGESGLYGDKGHFTKDYWYLGFKEANAILELAKRNRKNATPAEKVLWHELRAKKLGHHFHRQKPMGRSIVDFVCLKKRVVVEADGGYHSSEAMLLSDAERDLKFQRAGYIILRFSNDQVLNGLSEVLKKIKETLENRADRQEAYPDERVYQLNAPTGQQIPQGDQTAGEDNLNEPTAHPTPLPRGEGPGERVFPVSQGDQTAGKGSLHEPTAHPAPLPRGEGPGERVSPAFITVPDSAVALAQLAVACHGNPSQDLTLVGITGTNGKTTVATLLHDLFTALGYKAGLLSTVEVRIGQEVSTATHTTPDAVAINARLREMRDAGCDYVFMEVSSHAVDQKRTHGLAFAAGVFTNLTHDHLDYHETFAAYRDAKKGFFDQLPKSAFALVNADDRNGDFMLQNTKARKLRYSLRKVTNYRAKVLSNSPQGLQLELDGTEVFTRLIGRFNAYNLLAAFAVARELGMDRDETLVALSSLEAAAGRLDHVADPNGGITAVVDYAHTPDALENVLTTLREVMSPTARLLCVVGAGGDRDKTKRPAMARLAASLADQAILTSDNPRTEDPEAILNDMQAGLDTPTLLSRALRIADRRSAIRTAVQLARAQDVILVAGKGHETYQEIKGERLPFDDKLELANALNTRAHVG